MKTGRAILTGLGMLGAGSILVCSVNSVLSDRYAAERAREYLAECPVRSVYSPAFTADGGWIGERPKVEGESDAFYRYLHSGFDDFLRKANHIRDLNMIHKAGNPLVPDMDRDWQIRAFNPFQDRDKRGVEVMSSEPTGKTAGTYLDSLRKSEIGRKMK